MKASARDWSKEVFLPKAWGDEPYDVLFSLGGNCTAAHNLLFHNLRKVSYPLDWCYIVDEKPLVWLKEGFRTRFRDFCLRENLVELQGDERARNHGGRLQYKDTLTGYHFVNHFTHSISDEALGYTPVYTKLRRRIDRFFENCKNAKRILLLFSTNKPIEGALLEEVREALQQEFPRAEVKLVVVFFSAPENGKYETVNSCFFSWRRDYHLYDYVQTSFEWAFLSNVSIPPPPPPGSGYCERWGKGFGGIFANTCCDRRNVWKRGYDVRARSKACNLSCAW